MASKLYCELRKIYSASLMRRHTTRNLTRQKFDKIQWFSGTNASASNSVFEAVRQTLHIIVCEKVCGQTTIIIGGKKPRQQLATVNDTLASTHILSVIFFILNFEQKRGFLNTICQ